MNVLARPSTANIRLAQLDDAGTDGLVGVGWAVLVGGALVAVGRAVPVGDGACVAVGGALVGAGVAVCVAAGPVWQVAVGLICAG